MENTRRAIKLQRTEDQFYAAIGRFIVEFSSLENNLKIYVSNAIDLSVDNFFEIMTHDFAMLCTIAQKILSRGLDKKGRGEAERFNCKVPQTE